MSDKINPTYYKNGTIETMDYIESLGHGEAFCVSCIIKYVSRYKQKNGVEDLKKALWYLERLIALQAPEQK